MLFAKSQVSQGRHCEVRSNRELYKADLLIGDCFVPRNDVFLFISSHPDINIPLIKDIGNQPANHHKADGE
ncbi:hypothetical protein FHW88_002280 [Mucilaginibacter sp. SG538B]|nr:hypothetical protein [Mucilaginibacter sp. SG538B]